MPVRFRPRRPWPVCASWWSGSAVYRVIPVRIRYGSPLMLGQGPWWPGGFQHRRPWFDSTLPREDVRACAEGCTSHSHREAPGALPGSSTGVCMRIRRCLASNARRCDSGHLHHRRSSLPAKVTPWYGVQAGPTPAASSVAFVLMVRHRPSKPTSRVRFSADAPIAAHSEGDELGVPLRDCGIDTRGPLQGVMVEG